MRFVFLVFLLCFVAFASTAKEKAVTKTPLLTPDPPGLWRTLSHDDATTTSQCLGSNKTPLCALETYESCWFRHKKEWCDVTGSPYGYPEGPVKDDHRSLEEWQEYRVLKVQWRTEDGVVDPREQKPLFYKRGDLSVVLRWRTSCYYPDGPFIFSCSANYRADTVYWLRSEKGGWKLIGELGGLHFDNEDLVPIQPYPPGPTGLNATDQIGFSLVWPILPYVWLISA